MPSRFIGFILRPLVAPIRYGALKVMKKYRAPDDGRPIIATAGHILDEFIFSSVFHTFKEDKFRELARFRKLPVSEHDRIFNELAVAGVCLPIFYLHAVKRLVKPEDYHFWQNVAEQLPRQFQKKLISYGVDGGNAKLMRELIEMRYAEYEELLRMVRDVNDNNLESEFKTLPSEMKWIGSAIQAVAIGTTDHVRRGKVEEGDKLIRYLDTWLLLLHRKLRRFVSHL